MNLAGGSWMWSDSLRYLFSLPMMAVLVWQKSELKGVLSAIARAPWTWLLLAVFAGVDAGLPSGGQMLQSLIVAVFSGVIATMLFFEATNLVKHNHQQLAVVEATQPGEVLFTLFGGCFFLGDQIPTPLGFLGVFIVIIGIVGNSLMTSSD